MWIQVLYKSWDDPRSRFGDAAVVAFLVMQCLDGVFTYLGVGIWGPGIEANPIVASAMAAGGIPVGLFGAVAIVPWAALLLIP